jgi:hypothetical protein
VSTPSVSQRDLVPNGHWWPFHSARDRGVKLTVYLHPEERLRMRMTIPLSQWTGVKHANRLLSWNVDHDIFLPNFSKSSLSIILLFCAIQCVAKVTWHSMSSNGKTVSSDFSAILYSLWYKESHKINYKIMNICANKWNIYL